MGWQDKNVVCGGAVLFRGTMPPVAEDFADLTKAGIRITRAKADNCLWTLRLDHPKWGTAYMAAKRDPIVPPRLLIDMDPGLTGSEKQVALSGRTSVMLEFHGQRGNVLSDRKLLFRYLRAVMGDDGVAAVDHVAHRFWSRESLDEELGHDAALDIQSIHVLHVITDEVSSNQTCHVESGSSVHGPSGKQYWLHSHGLAEIGFLDFDILNPSEDLISRGTDLLRAIAFALAEGKVRGSVPTFPLAMPGGIVRFVEVGEFLRKAPKVLSDMRSGAEDGHNSKRVVLCEPEGKLLGRWFGKIKPCKFLSGEVPDEILIMFSDQATALMAERARNTYSVFRGLAQELREFEFPVLAKLGYTVDGGKEDNREHLWFEVHEMGDSKLDATLTNQPYNIARIKQGQRDWHDAALMSDWTILTPLGAINPRSMLPVRTIRAHRDEFRQAFREAKARAGD